MSFLDQAITFASLAHAGQRRAGGLPYITHPLNVMSIVSCVDSSDEMLMAAVLHDVVEDCAVSIETIERRFGGEVAKLVGELTTPVREGNRAERNAAELERLAKISKAGATIKLADIIDNVRTIKTDKSDFAATYVTEKLAQYDVLIQGHGDMRMRAAKALVEAL